MKRLLNTLYITTPGTYLARENETVVVRHEGEVKLRVPVRGLCGIVCFGRVGCSPQLMGLCAQNGIAISFLSSYGRYWARVQGPVSGNVLLRREQYRRADHPEAAAEVTRDLLLGKVANARAVLQRAVRDHPQSPGTQQIAEAGERLRLVLKALAQPVSVDTARGYEGEAARAYFSAFDHLITAQKDEFHFSYRNRRPPLDRVNALLSFLYSLLVHDTAAALECVGLDPAVGFLHRDRPGRPGLALDLMEEQRSFVADRLVLSLINRWQVRPEGFEVTETGAVQMDDATRKVVLTAYQSRKQEEIEHPFLGEKIPVGLISHVQAMLLARYLRGDLDAYPPFLWK
ncbi:type I-C CRISPR-associated endonuclease Cas1c [bacterium]|nr:type I-C CRISPR-associated endonuclease Cas1c [bacterium]